MDTETQAQPDTPVWHLPAKWPPYTTHEQYVRTMQAMPEDAIVADWSKHAPHNSRCPIFWYVDQPCQCRDCGAAFVFTKEDQRVWYEQHKLPIYVKAIRCLRCRRTQRKAQRARGQKTRA